MTDDQFRQLRDDLQLMRNEMQNEFRTIDSRIVAIETTLQRKANKVDVFRSVFFVNGGFIAVVSFAAMALRTFGVV